MNPLTPRFGAALKTVWENAEVKKTAGKGDTDSFVAAFFNMTNSAELPERLNYDVLSPAGIDYMTVRAYDPETKNRTEYLLIDTPGEPTLTETRKLVKEMQDISKPDYKADWKAYQDFQENGQARIDIALGFLLTLKGLVKPQAPTLTIEHSGGVISEITNKDTIINTLKALISPKA